MTNLGLELIKSFEGCRLKAYKCPAGIWTIGYGDTFNVQPGMVITQAEADARLTNHVIKFEQQVRALIKEKMNDNQISALTSFAYNLGTGALKSSTLLKRVNGGDMNVRNEFEKWVRAGGKILPGLVIRRSVEASLFEGDTKTVEATLASRGAKHLA